MLVLGAAAACSAPPVSTDAHAPARQAVKVAVWRPHPEVYVLVADDDVSFEARALRHKVVGSLRGALTQEQPRFGGCANDDPAEWHAKKVSVIVARPSAPDDETWITPRDVPALSWTTRDATTMELGAVVEAVSDAIEGRVPRRGDVYRPIDAAQRSLDLLSGVRAPASAAERALQQSVPEGAIVRVLLASTRDDGGLTAVEPWRPTDLAEVTTVGPFHKLGVDCAATRSSGTRLEAWTERAGRLYAWPCEDEESWRGFLWASRPDCYGRCEPWKVSVSAVGVADCDVTVVQDDLSRCDADRGFFDPGGKATFVEQHGFTQRKCEIAQLHGPELALCRTSLDCPGCGSGWCATEVPELLPFECREEGWYPWPIRFVGGVGAGGSGLVTVDCATVGHPVTTSRLNW